MPTRRAAVALIAIAALPLGSRAVRAQSESVLRVLTTTNDGSAGVFYAQMLGSFKKVGLTAQIQIMNSGEAAAAAVVGGAADIGVGNVLSFAVFHDKGVGLTLLAPASLSTSTEPTTGLVVAGDSALRSARDLNAKTVAVPAINDLNSMAMRWWLDKNGGDSRTIKFFELPTAQMIAAVQNHTIDAAMMAVPALSNAVGAGLKMFAVPYAAVAPKFCANAWYARKEWVAAHRDDAKRFAIAVGEAQAWGNGNHAASAKIVADVSKIDLGVLEKMPRATYGERFDPGLLQPVVDLAAHYHLISAPFPASDLYEHF